MAYNAFSQVTQITRTLNGTPLTTSFEYNDEGDLTARSDSTGRRWEWSYDAIGRPTQVKNPLQAATSLAWDQTGNLVSKTDRLGQRAEYQWGAGDRLEQATYRRANGTVESTVTLHYDPDTHLLTQGGSVRVSR